MILGPSVRLSDFSTIDAYGGRILIGAHFYLGRYSLLQGYGDITIGEHVMIGPHSSIIASSHSYADWNRSMRSQPIDGLDVVIGDDVWIGAGVRVLGGIEIARGAIVGAGAVLTRSVGQGEIYAGVPARLVGRRNIPEPLATPGGEVEDEPAVAQT